MASESDPIRRVPSLVYYCQRVLSAHADAIACLGDDIRYDVIKPVLECCSADTLLRLEQSSPYLQQDTSDLWERLCFKSYPLLAEQLVQNVDEQPESWRDQYFLLREAEAHRLEEVASRLRNQRIEAAERKKEREVKLTDKLPPAKRARAAWGSSGQPMSLFQKTRNEASKLSRSLHMPRLAQKMPLADVHRPATATSPAPPTTRPVNTRSGVKSPLANRPSSAGSQPTLRSVQSTNLTVPLSHKGFASTPKLPMPAHPQSQPTDSRPSKPSIQKKDPMASLFMPKRRSPPQLSARAGSNNHTVPTR